MTTRSATETALTKLAETIEAAVAGIGMPSVTRNEAIESLLGEAGDDVGIKINLIDGDQVSLEIMAGAEVNDFDGFNIVHGPTVEIIILCKDPERRDRALDDVLVALHDALKADRSLGDVVSFARFAQSNPVQRSNLAIDGLPHVKGAVVSLELAFFSNRPF